MSDHFYDFENNPSLLARLREFLESELCSNGKEKFAVVFNQLIDSKVTIRFSWMNWEWITEFLTAQTSDAIHEERVRTSGACRSSSVTPGLPLSGIDMMRMKPQMVAEHFTVLQAYVAFVGRLG